MVVYYQIITDEPLLDAFLDSLPDTDVSEVYYLCLFGRHKYDPSWPNTRDSNQLVRATCRKKDLKERIRRLAVPVGAYTRDGVIASQACLAVYLSLNPRSLPRANQGLIVELARRIADGHLDFNPVSLAQTEIHRTLGRRYFLDFDFDNVSLDDVLPQVRVILPDEAMYRILKTKGGFHLIVNLERIQGLRSKWYPALSDVPGCDVRGAHTLTPVPGCVQGGFTPYFVQ